MSSSHSSYHSQKGRSSPESDSNAGTVVSSEQSQRRPSRAGTRSVSQLTQVQLERKRANDREAQRAIRQRNRDRIENLEGRIRELQDSREPSQQLLEALRRIKDLEEENMQLRLRLDQAGIPALVGERGDPWSRIGPQPSPIHVQPGLPVSNPASRSPGLLNPRDPQVSPQTGYPYRNVAQWPGTNPFGDPSGPGQESREGSASPAPRMNPQQYAGWAATGTDRTRLVSQGNTGAGTARVEYSGLSSEQTSHGQPLSYQDVAASSQHGQSGIALTEPTGYVPIPGGPYMHHPELRHAAQQSSSRYGPSGGEPPSGPTQDSQARYYSNFPPP